MGRPAISEQILARLLCAALLLMGTGTYAAAQDDEAAIEALLRAERGQSAAASSASVQRLAPGTVIPLREVARYVGLPLRIQTAERSFDGVLRGVDTEGVSFSYRGSGGTITIKLEPTQIQRIEAR